MTKNIVDNPFDELPEALVEEMLQNTEKISTNLSNNFRKISKKKEYLRQSLDDKGLLKNTDDISASPTYPTSCGIDGSYTIEKLVSTDISAVAAVAIEGLTPPGPEKKYWPRPRHFSHIGATNHSDATSLVLRGIMMNMELQLAFNAPHDVVFLDGSLTTPFIYIHQAIKSISEVSNGLVTIFKKGKEQKNEDDVKFPGIKESFIAYKTILSSSKSDKIFAGIPKYSTENKVCEILNLDNYEDKGLLNFILGKDEFIKPIPLDKKFHLENPPEEIIESLGDLYVVYYRPSTYFPVIRIEISSSIANNQHRLFKLFEALKIQCVTLAIMEPYPLYLADRMVKHLGTAIPAIRKTITQEMSLKWEESLGNMYLAMHGYRTEWGK